MKKDSNRAQPHFGLTAKILIGMALGTAVGLFLHFFHANAFISEYVIEGILKLGGQVFITLMKMLVVPVVFVSLVCGVCNLDDARKLGRIGLKSVILFLATTALAITMAIFVADLLGIGIGTNLGVSVAVNASQAPSWIDTLVNIFPNNPFAAMVQANMLQIIVFAILLGTAMTLLSTQVPQTVALFNELNLIVTRLATLVIHATPYGVFCLLASLFAREGYIMISHLLGYFLTVLFVLLSYVFLANGLLLKCIARLNPFIFFKKMYSAQMFAFSTASSNVSIPIVLETVEFKLGVKNSVASFIIPLGATVNMAGTAIMQGTATVFIANAYNIDISLMGYLTVIVSATLAAVGTAGVPGVGLITLAMVLHQVGVPADGIGLIIGVDRFLDMVRTAVNITGDAAAACVVGKWEGALDETVYNDPQREL